MSASVNVITLSVDDFQRFIEQAATKAVSAQQKATTAGLSRAVEPVYTVKQAAERMKCGESTVRRLLEKRRLVFIQDGGLIWIKESAILDYWERFQVGK